MRDLFKNKNGFGIVEVLVSAVVLGLMYLALLHMQTGNRETLLRIRGRDGAIQVAQQVMDSLKSVGVTAIPSSMDEDTTFALDTITREWTRERNGEAFNTSVLDYRIYATVSKSSDFLSKNITKYDTTTHVYAKHVEIKVCWDFKGAEQTIVVSGVIR